MTAAPASGSLGVSRDASRHVGGLGLAFRGATSDVFAKALNLYGTPAGFAHAQLGTLLSAPAPRADERDADHLEVQRLPVVA